MHARISVGQKTRINHRHRGSRGRRKPCRRDKTVNTEVLTSGPTNYKVDCEIGSKPADARAIQAILDTGAGPNIVHADVLPQKWLEKVSPDSVRIRDASRNTLSILGSLPLYLRIGDLQVKVKFYVAENLATKCILGTAFADRYVTAILPQKRKVCLKDSRSIALAGSHHEPDNPPHGSTPDNLVKVARAMKIAPMTQTSVWVQTKRAGLSLLQAHPRLAAEKLALMANGIIETLPQAPFKVLVSNFSTRTISLPKNLIIGIALPAPAAISYIDENFLTSVSHQEMPPTEEGASNRSTSGSNEDPDTGKNKEVNPNSGNETRTTPNWETEVSIGDDVKVDRQDVLNLLREFSPMWSGELGTVKATQHRIDLIDGAKPVYQPPYKAGPTARQIEKEEVQRMLAAGVIEPSMAEWASPVVLVPKPDGSKRFCIDYRRLNALTIRDSYPIPRMDECIDSLGEATVFTTLDANSGYWQVEIAPEDRDKTTFTCHEGLYRVIRMPFGLKNAPATFQRAIDIILSRVKWQYALVYLDDVIIYSKTVEEHFRHVRTVLTLLQSAGISLKLKKCAFFTAAVDYLGHRIKPGKLEVASETCDAIRHAQPPTTQTEIRSFIGLCNVYRRFVKNFARIAAPLNNKLHKDQPKSFGALTDEEFEAFATLRNHLINPPILALPKVGKKYIVETDACDEQVGCVLLQEQDTEGDFRPIGYWSRTLNPAERNYTTTERECLAIVWSILMLRPYIEGTRFTVRTDHDSLRWLLNLADASGRLARWRLRLAEYEYDVVHRPGIKHQAPDALSRLPTKGTDQSPLDDDIPCFIADSASRKEDSYEEEYEGDFDGDYALTADEVRTLREIAETVEPISVEELIREQAADAYCQSLLTEVTTDNSQFVIDHHGLICRRSNLDGALQRVVPVSLRERVLYLSHYQLLAGHPGGYKMYATLRREYYWPFMANDTYDFVRKCKSCIKVRGTTRRHSRKLVV